jgi:hypothetical protein
VKDLLTLVQEYADACANFERHRTLAECTVVDDAAAKAIEYDSTSVACHARLMTAFDALTRTTVRAVPDQRLPVCTWQRGTVEARAVLPDGSRAVHVRYTPGQAIAAGAALIACAALADKDTGGSLTLILPAFPEPSPPAALTAAGDSTEGSRS